MQKNPFWDLKPLDEFLFNSVIMAEGQTCVFFFFFFIRRETETGKELSGTFNQRVELPRKSWLDVR